MDSKYSALQDPLFCFPRALLRWSQANSLYSKSMTNNYSQADRNNKNLT